jgi:Pilin (bacterial filament).
LPEAAYKSGKYVSEIEVSDGVITITYGLQANKQIKEDNSNKLSLVPGTNQNDDVIWVCGKASPPAGAELATSENAITNVPDKYLPASCREGFGGTGS